METIVALSSGLPAAIAIIRLSGKDALRLLSEVYKTKIKITPRVMTYGTIMAGDISDNVTAVYFKAPNSYTGEDVVEIYTHGSRPVINALINCLVNKGARLAEPGEFTLRAYVNNKLDLTAAEGIVSLINAQTENQAKAAYNLLDGRLRHKIESFQKRLINAIAFIEADLDYPEEDVLSEEKQNIKEIVGLLKGEIEQLKESYNQGRLIKDGVRVVLAGNVNVGKSSIINVLLNKERVIVSSEAGTTRDIVEDSYFYKGQKFILTDTAGIRETKNEIENIGVKKALSAYENADIILSVSTPGEDFIKLSVDKKTLFVENKCDLGASNNNAINISALKNINIDYLKEEIYKTAFESNGNKDKGNNDKDNDGGKENSDAEIITDLRHYNCLDLCFNSLSLALEDINSLTFREISDCIAAQLREAYNSLGQITGVIGSDEIVNEIFSKFCVGK